MSSDCELIRDGLFAQPVNAISSLAYLVAAAALIVRERRRIRGRVLAAAIAIGSNGVGGVAYHGTGGTAGRVVHDVAVVAAAAVVISAAAATVVQRRRRRDDRGDRTWLLVLVTGGVAIAVYVTSRTGGPLCDPDSLLQGHAAWHVLTALVLFWCGRSVALDPPQPSRRGP